MGAALKLITDDLAGALTKALHEPRLGDIPEMHRAIFRLQLLMPDVTLATPIQAVRAKLDREITKERNRHQRKHWSADMNRLIALQMFASLIEEFRP